MPLWQTKGNFMTGMTNGLSLLSAAEVAANLYALDLAADTAAAAQDDIASTDSFEGPMILQLASNPLLANLADFHTKVVAASKDEAPTAQQLEHAGVDLMQQGLNIFKTAKATDDEQALRGARQTYVKGLLTYANLRENSAPTMWTGRAAELRFDMAIAKGTKDFSRIDFRDVPQKRLSEALNNNPDLFKGANLTEANLFHAYLPYADLTGANLTGADLSGADLTGAKLTGGPI
jgi:uncharacterized protein YjbI with pentapeptide repeats